MMNENHACRFIIFSFLTKGVRVWEMPPNGQGLVALVALNILKHLDLNKDNSGHDSNRLSSSTMHKLIEAVHLGFADGFKHIADTTDPDVIKRLLSEEYGKEKAGLIRDDRYQILRKIQNRYNADEGPD